MSTTLRKLTDAESSKVIQMAWEDRTTFESIQEAFGLNESAVVKLMRSELKKGSFKLWRERMRGRITKHRALRDSNMPFAPILVANHRRANA